MTVEAKHTQHFNPFDFKANYSGTANNTKSVHWPLMDGLLHLVQRGGAWAGCSHVMVRCSAVLMW